MIFFLNINGLVKVKMKGLIILEIFVVLDIINILRLISQNLKLNYSKNS